MCVVGVIVVAWPRPMALLIISVLYAPYIIYRCDGMSFHNESGQVCANKHHSLSHIILFSCLCHQEKPFLAVFWWVECSIFGLVGPPPSSSSMSLSTKNRVVVWHCLWKAYASKRAACRRRTHPSIYSHVTKRQMVLFLVMPCNMQYVVKSSLYRYLTNGVLFVRKSSSYAHNIYTTRTVKLCVVYAPLVPFSTLLCSFCLHSLPLFILSLFNHPLTHSPDLRLPTHTPILSYTHTHTPRRTIVKILLVAKLRHLHIYQTHGLSFALGPWVHNARLCPSYHTHTYNIHGLCFWRHMTSTVHTHMMSEVDLPPKVWIIQINSLLFTDLREN